MKAEKVVKYSCSNCSFTFGYTYPKNNIRIGAKCPKCLDGKIEKEDTKLITQLGK